MTADELLPRHVLALELGRLAPYFTPSPGRTCRRIPPKPRASEVLQEAIRRLCEPDPADVTDMALAMCAEDRRALLRTLSLADDRASVPAARVLAKAKLRRREG